MDFIEVAKADRITTVTLNRPQVMNAIHAPMHEELQAAFDDFAADPGQLVCVVTGAGERAFCAGTDLKSVVLHGRPAYPADGYAGLIERFDLNKPVIAAVNGFALGGGFEIALACDIIIAADTARFGLPEPKVGAVALAGGVHRLARQIGLKQAMGMMLTSRLVDAAEGARLGFVNEVVAAKDLGAATMRWCSEILQGAPASIRATKQAAMRGLDEPSLAEAIRNQKAYPEFVAWRAGEDVKEGPRAFAEKRPPRWTGR